MNKFRRFLLVILPLLLFLFNANAQQWEKAKEFNYITKYSNPRQVTDKAGNIFIAGEFSISEPLVMDGIELNSKGSTDIFIAKLDSNFVVIWAKSFGSQGDEMFGGITLDHNNDIVFCGYFSLKMLVGKDTLKSHGLTDFFLAKMDSSGNVKWTTSGGSEYTDYNRTLGGLITDDQNHIYVTGMFGYENNSGVPNKRIAWFDTFTIKSFGGQDVFISRYSAGGNLEWIKNVGGNSDEYSNIFLKDKYLYVCGFSNYELHYDTSIFKNPYGGADIGFVLKMDLEGTIRWVKGSFLKEFGSMGIRSITVDSRENVYVTGSYYTISFDNRLVFGNYQLEGVSGTDIFLAKLDKNGKVKWLKNAASISNDVPLKIITKNDNHFIITGDIGGGGIYEGESIINGISSFILDIDSNGKPLFFEPCGTNGNNSGSDLSLTPDNKLIVIGDNRAGSLTFDSIVLTKTDKQASLFIAKRNYKTKQVNIPKVSKLKCNIYPNPANDFLMIELPSNVNDKYCIQVLSSDGKLLDELNMSSSFEINTSKYEAGLYLIILTNNITREIHKISLQH